MRANEHPVSVVYDPVSTWVYAYCKDEQTLLPYFLDAYSFASRVILYDAGSQDKSVEIAQSFGAEVRVCPWVGLDDARAAQFSNQQYKEARGKADWVIWVDIDEIIYHPFIQQRLAELKAASIDVARVDGYSMFSADPPTGSGHIWDVISTGIKDWRYCKPCVLNPELEFAWGPGRHEIWIPGPYTTNEADPLSLLHYRYLGENWHLARNTANYESLVEHNGLGIETYPGANVHHSPQWYREQADGAYDVIAEIRGCANQVRQ